ncbi:MAG TPA: NAD(P)H-hydrate dehydratase [Candidatus Marinimicrobia bacterium]|nr:NAD(P)H-hydrate dehydratase [Candidatus Neomarinimicrobiota bacterium]
MKAIHRVLTAKEAKEADRITIQEIGIPGEGLMAKAGLAAADEAFALLSEKHLFRCQIFAGKGNNGGDGFVVALHLALRGIQVELFVLPKAAEICGDALFHFQKLQGLNIQIYFIDSAEELTPMLRADALWVDALLGTGLNRPVAGAVAEWLHILKKYHQKQPVLAIDIPSGLDASNGMARGEIIPADVTVSMGFYKFGNFIQEAKNFTRRLVIADLDYPDEAFRGVFGDWRLIDEEMLQKALPKIKASAHKFEVGQCVLIGGNGLMSGAISLSAMAALRSGVGMLHAIVPGTCAADLNHHSLETIVHARKYSDHLTPDDLALLDPLRKKTRAWVIGPGLGRHPETKLFLPQFLRSVGEPVLIDADALYLLDETMLQSVHSPWILTPHWGEFLQLSGASMADLMENSVQLASDFAQKYRLILHLKGAVSLTAFPEGGGIVHHRGDPGMATAGSGDVLSGIFGALLTTGLSPQDAAACAPFIHGCAGELAAEALGSRSLNASDIIHYLSKVYKQYDHYLAT